VLFRRDSEIIISTNRGEPLVLKRNYHYRDCFENAARRLVGKQDYFVDLNAPYKGLFAQFVHSIKKFLINFAIDLTILLARLEQYNDY
jgi:septum formation inhibitor-activating ATPase MinD